MAWNCESCKMLEKYKYWNQFPSNRHHFFKIMLGDFRRRVRIPKKFTTYFKEGLSSMILLRGPSGNKWSVEVRRRDGDFLFQNGWEQFAQDHSLEETESREGSYFVRKPREPCSHEACVMQEKEREDSTDATFSDEDEEGSLEEEKPKKQRGNESCITENLESSMVRWHKGKLNANKKEMDKRRGEIVEGETKSKKLDARLGLKLKGEEMEDDPIYAVSEAQQYTLQEKHKKEYKEETKSGGKHVQFHTLKCDKTRESLSAMPDDALETFHSYKKNQMIGKGVEGTKSLQVEQKPKVEPEIANAPVNGKCSYPLYFISNRRPVTLEEKQRAYQLASRHSSPAPSVLITMQPTHVSKGFMLAIPRSWATKHIPDKSQEIQLRVLPSEKIWAAQISCRPEGSVMICKGWTDFVLDNNLEEHDVCIFELAQGGLGIFKLIILDVFLYRVVDELVPLTRFVVPQSMRKSTRY